MKRIIIYLLSILLGMILAIYIFIIWEPLKDKDITSNKINITKEMKIKDNSIKMKKITGILI